MNDLIERQEVMDAIHKCTDVYVNNLPIMIYKAELYKAILELPSAEPEMKWDEWCTDCKEYDQERHCCPRFNRVIQNALEEMNENIKSLVTDRNTNPAHADDGK